MNRNGTGGTVDTLSLEGIRHCQRISSLVDFNQLAVNRGPRDQTSAVSAITAGKHSNT
jgi:hypothetical protein